jgi:hypothetical protein
MTIYRTTCRPRLDDCCTEAAKAERARICKWLRERADLVDLQRVLQGCNDDLSIGEEDGLRRAADDIEAGNSGAIT